MIAKAYQVTKERMLARSDVGEMSQAWFTNQSVDWIDVVAENNDEIRQALAPMNLKEPILKALTSPTVLPRVIVFESLLVAIVPVLRVGRRPTWVRFLCGPMALFSIHDEPIAELDKVSDDLCDDLRLADASVAALLIQLLESIQAGMIPLFLGLRRNVDHAAEQLELNPSEASAEELLSLKRHASAFANQLEDHQLLVLELHAARSDALKLDSVRDQFRDMITSIERGCSIIARLDRRVDDLRQTYASLLHESTNRRLKVLTVLSAVYLPATLIAGIYGMNFEHIPMLTLRHGYFIVMCIMFALVTGQFLFFWRRGWLR